MGLLTAALVLAAACAGCGGGGTGSATGTETPTGSGQKVSGPGFSFEAPADWTVSVQPTSARASGGVSTLVSVEVLPLVRQYRPALFPRVVTELDRVANELAAQLGGTVTSRRTVDVAGTKARAYEIAHGKLVDRITFVLRRKKNFQLTCRWQAQDGEPAACGQLSASFAFR